MLGISFQSLLTNPHPALSGFPGVILILLFCGELISLNRPRASWPAVRNFLLFGLAVFLPFTYFSGYWAAEAASQSFLVSDEVIMRHQGIGKFLLFLVIGLLLVAALRSAVSESAASERRMAWLYRGLLLICVVTVFVAGSLGGELVFKYGAGVQVNEPTPVAPTTLPPQ